MATAKKTTTKKPAAKKAAEKKAEPAKTGDYAYAVGRRKSSIATVRLYSKGKGEFTVNGKPLAEYLPVEILQESVLLPLKTVGMDQTSDVTVKAQGGGIRGQADAIRLGVARALLEIDENYRAALKPYGFLTRDPREKERKKPGLRKARRAPQWAKR